ncbi:MAG: hypothetical protein ACTSUE_10490 [Promethearchaeota archaeon]
MSYPQDDWTAEQEIAQYGVEKECPPVTTTGVSPQQQQQMGWGGGVGPSQQQQQQQGEFTGVVYTTETVGEGTRMQDMSMGGGKNMGGSISHLVSSMIGAQMKSRTDFSRQEKPDPKTVDQHVERAIGCFSKTVKIGCPDLRYVNPDKKVREITHYYRVSGTPKEMQGKCKGKTNKIVLRFPQGMAKALDVYARTNELSKRQDWEGIRSHPKLHEHLSEHAKQSHIDVKSAKVCYVHNTFPVGMTVSIPGMRMTKSSGDGVVFTRLISSNMIHGDDSEKDEYGWDYPESNLNPTEFFLAGIDQRLLGSMITNSSTDTRASFVSYESMIGKQMCTWVGKTNAANLGAVFTSKEANDGEFTRMRVDRYAMPALMGEILSKSKDMKKTLKNNNMYITLAKFGDSGEPWVKKETSEKGRRLYQSKRVGECIVGVKYQYEILAPGIEPPGAAPPKKEK